MIFFIFSPKNLIIKKLLRLVRKYKFQYLKLLILILIKNKKINKNLSKIKLKLNQIFALLHK